MKKNGLTLIETLFSISIGTSFFLGVINYMLEESRQEAVQRFANESYDIIRAVDHRIAIDGYNNTLWNKTSWVDEDEIKNNLIKKELTSKFSSNCSGGEWEPTSASEENVKLITCNQWTGRSSDGEKMSAELVNDSVGFIEGFNLYISYPDKKDFKKKFTNMRKATNKLLANRSQEISGLHSIDIVSLNTKSEITMQTCLANTADCAMRFSLNRNGGNEYLRVDGLNSMIADHITFIESKDQSPMKCVRWKNTKRDGTGTWSREIDEECGIGIYKNEPHPIMVDVVADTGTFKSIVLDQECKVFGWNGTTVVDTGVASPCGMLNDDSAGEMIQVIDNIQSKESSIGQLYAGTARMKDLFINDIVAKTITSEIAEITSRLKTDLISSYSGSNLITVSSNLTLKEMLNIEKNVYAHENMFVAKNTAITGSLQVGNGVISDGIIQANNVINLNKVMTEGAICTTDGSIARNADGNVLNCVNGKWENMQGKAVPVGTIIMWGSTTIPDGWLELNGQSTSGYPLLAALYGSRVPDFRGQFVRAWDHGKGVDSGRSLLSNQSDAIRNIKGSAGFGATGGGSGYASGAFTQSYYRFSERGGNRNGTMLNFDASRVVPTANENRPKNISVMYLIKAK